jgi:hypothetical protein
LQPRLSAPPLYSSTSIRGNSPHGFFVPARTKEIYYLYFGFNNYIFQNMLKCRVFAFLVIIVDISSASSAKLGFFMKEMDFKRRSRITDQYADNKNSIQLRQVAFRSLANYDPMTLFKPETHFTVVIAHLLPWVIIEGLDTDLDPGNFNQLETRT